MRDGNFRRLPHFFTFQMSTLGCLFSVRVQFYNVVITDF